MSTYRPKSVSLNDDALVAQAVRTSTEYLQEAVDSIDKQFGSGYAKKNPVLVAAMVSASASDYHTQKTAQRWGEMEGAVVSGLESLRGAIESLADSVHGIGVVIGDRKGLAK